MRAILMPYGINDAGQLAHVDDVPNGKACGLRCPSCTTPLQAKNGGRKVRHHLAHLAGNPSCEGWMHATAKLLLYKRIADAMAADNPLTIEWSCGRWPFIACRVLHKADLLGKRILDRVCLEQQLPAWNIRPDIVLLYGEEPKVLIEVVDTHRPETTVIASNLPVLEIHITEPSDLEALAEGPVPIEVIHNYPCPDPCCDVCDRLKSEGCDYCDRCGKHRSLRHTYCQTCNACTDPPHRHRYCDRCNATVVEEHWEQEGSGCGGWTHLHCEGCGRLLRPETRGTCGCLKTFCKPCWRKP